MKDAHSHGDCVGCLHAEILHKPKYVLNSTAYLFTSANCDRQKGDTYCYVPNCCIVLLIGVFS